MNYYVVAVWAMLIVQSFIFAVVMNMIRKDYPKKRISLINGV
jgi:hypothetical protein